MLAVEEVWTVYLERISGRGKVWHDVVLATSREEAIRKAEQANPGYRTISARNDL